MSNKIDFNVDYANSEAILEIRFYWGVSICYVNVCFCVNDFSRTSKNRISKNIFPNDIFMFGNIYRSINLIGRVTECLVIKLKCIVWSQSMIKCENCCNMLTLQAGLDIKCLYLPWWSTNQFSKDSFFHVCPRWASPENGHTRSWIRATYEQQLRKTYPSSWKRFPATSMSAVFTFPLMISLP